MIKIIYVCDTGRKILIDEKEVFDDWYSPTFDELTKLLKRNGITDNDEVNLSSLYECIESCSTYQGSLEISIGYECKRCKNGCELL